MTGESARLFVALELPDPAAGALQSWVQAHLSAVTGLRPVPPAALHVTLCFLGSQPVPEIGAIAAACGAVAGLQGVDLRLGEPLWLPRRRPRVLAVELEDASGALTGLQGMVAGALERGGWYELEARPFLPHVTVGRFGRAGGRPVDLAAPPPVEFAGASVALLRSRSGPGGSRYERLDSVGLGCPASGKAAAPAAPGAPAARQLGGRLADAEGTGRAGGTEGGHRREDPATPSRHRVRRREGAERGKANTAGSAFPHPSRSRLVSWKSHGASAAFPQNARRSRRPKSHGSSRWGGGGSAVSGRPFRPA